MFVWLSEEGEAETSMEGDRICVDRMCEGLERATAAITRTCLELFVEPSTEAAPLTIPADADEVDVADGFCL